MIVRGRNNGKVVMTIHDNSSPEIPEGAGMLKAAIKIDSRDLSPDRASGTSTLVLDGAENSFSFNMGNITTYNWQINDFGNNYNGGSTSISGTNGEIFTIDNIQPDDDIEVVLTITTDTGETVKALFRWQSDLTGRIINAVNADLLPPKEGLPYQVIAQDSSVIDTNTMTGGISSVDELGIDAGQTGTYDTIQAPPTVKHDFGAAGTYTFDYSINDSSTALPMGYYGKVGFKIQLPAA